MYKNTGRIRFSECDKDLKLSLHGLINYFQDTSTFQSEDLHVGIEHLEAIGCAWVLSYSYVEVYRMPKMGEDIEVATWPYKFKGFMASRNFLMTTKEGEVLASADTQWAYLDRIKQRMKKVDAEQTSRYKILPRYDMAVTSRKIDLPQVYETQEALPVISEYLDIYNHVNNEKYISLARAYLPEAYNVGSLRVAYMRQAKLGDVMVPKVSKTEAGATIVFDAKSGKPFAVVEFSAKGP